MARRLIALLFILSFSALSSGCATMPEQKDLESTLKEAAERYWNIRLKGELKDAYNMEYEEGGLPSDMDRYLYKAGLIRKFIITKHRIKEVTVEGKNGTVLLELHIRMPAIPAPFKQTMKDSWIWDGKWRHILNPKEFLKKNKKQTK